MHETSRTDRRGTSTVMTAVRSFAGALLLAAVATRGAAAQSAVTAQCVGGSIGCEQIDFTLTAMGTLPASVDFFRIAITGGDFRFTAAQSGDAIDDSPGTFFIPTVNAAGTLLSGSFIAGFEAVLNPFLQIRAQVLPNTQASTGSLAYTYEAGSNGQVQFSGAVTATPEPASLVLLATGLLAIGGMAARRRRAA